MHSLISLIQPEDAYSTHYGTAFPEPVRVGTYNPSINNNAMAVFRSRTELAHKAKHTNRAIYKTMWQGGKSQFILAVVVDTWIRDLRDTETLYTGVAPNALLSCLQVR